MEHAAIHLIILYDGVCGLCNRAVQFVVKHDRQQLFRFAALQGALAVGILRRHGLSPDALDTLYLVLGHGHPGERLLSRSDAVLATMRCLGGVWVIPAAIGRAIPEAIRDFAYNRIARGRYRIFGKRDACPIPTPEQQSRFLD